MVVQELPNRSRPFRPSIHIVLTVESRKLFAFRTLIAKKLEGKAVYNGCFNAPHGCYGHLIISRICKEAQARTPLNKRRQAGRNSARSQHVRDLVTLVPTYPRCFEYVLCHASGKRETWLRGYYHRHGCMPCARRVKQDAEAENPSITMVKNNNGDEARAGQASRTCTWPQNIPYTSSGNWCVNWRCSANNTKLINAQVLCQLFSIYTQSQAYQIRGIMASCIKVTSKLGSGIVLALQ